VNKKNTAPLYEVIEVDEEVYVDNSDVCDNNVVDYKRKTSTVPYRE
jgi:hypothetical protein